MYKDYNVDRSFATKAGNEVKLKEGGKKCVVYIGSAPEVVKGSKGEGTMDQEVPHVAFIGKKIFINNPGAAFFLVDVAGGRLRIPYEYGDSRESRNVVMHCMSRIDQFPVQTIHYETVKSFTAKELSGHGYTYFVLDDGVHRIDMVTLKAKNPDARIVIVKPLEIKPQVARSSVSIASDKTRASDAADESSSDGKNPVFMARVFLRNLELEKVRELIVQNQMSGEEMGFIGTFLKIMIANENNKPDLMRSEKELKLLAELYRIGAMLVLEDRAGFESSLTNGVPKYVSSALHDLASRRRSAATTKLEELLYWEWQYRLKKQQAT